MTRVEALDLARQIAAEPGREVCLALLMARGGDPE